MIRFKKISFEEFKKAFKGIDEQEIHEAYENIKLPTRSTKGSAGYDFYMHSNLVTDKGIYPTGIKAYMPKDTVLMIYPRSSLGMKHGFNLLNTVGIIDSDYADNPSNEGHIMVGFKADNTICLKTGDKLCQGIFISYRTTDDDSADGERVGGIGSTGK